MIGAQLLIWFTSGVVMSFLPIKEVRGEHLVDRERIAPLPSNIDAGALGVLIRREAPGTASFELAMIDGRLAARTQDRNGQKHLIDAVSGRALPPVDAATATRIARTAWKGDPKASTVAQRVAAESTDYHGGLPAWRIDFAGPDDARVYVEAATGRITAVRTGTWQLYDFFWGLHIMDWKNHEDFNTPWLLGFALGGLALGFAGTVLLVLRWPFLKRKHRISH